MTEANNVHPSEVGLATPPELSKKEKAKLANILGFFRDAADAAFPTHGFELMTDPARNVLAERMEALRPGTVVAQRGRLESDPYFRHPIPYILIHRQRADGSLEFFVYQRTKLIGEELLGQKFSVALGGHPELGSIRFNAEAEFDTEQTLLACLVSELDEEASFNGQTFTAYTEGGGMYTYCHDGFIRDDSDKVGLQHIAVVYAIGLPAEVEVLCTEEELITVGFRTLEELAADLELPPENAIYDFENWSRICILSYVERIEAIKAAEAVDALFLSEQGHAVDESEFLTDAEIAAQFENLPEPEPLGEAVIEAYRAEHGVDLTTLELPEGASIVQRGEMAFYVGEFINSPEGSKELKISLDPSDPDPMATVAAIRAELISQWKKEALVEAGSERGETPVFTQLNEVPFYQDGAVAGIDTAEFAKEVLDQAEGSVKVQNSSFSGQYMAPPIDPSPDTRDITELHRKVGTTDEQMQSAVAELTRISDSVQPTE